MRTNRMTRSRLEVDPVAEDRWAETGLPARGDRDPAATTLETRLAALVFVAAVVVLAAGCSGSGEAEPPGELIASSKPRITSPGTTADELARLVRDDTDFTFDVYRHVGAAGGNVFFSPHSLSMAFAMTYAGARGDTETQMAAALRFGLGQDRLHLAFDALDLALAARGAGNHDFALRSLNAVFVQKGFELAPAYLDVLAEDYGAGVRALDFAADPGRQRAAINHWISDATEGHIPELVPAAAVNGSTRLVLTNAIYFTARWQSRFNAFFTHDGAFTRADGSQVTVPMMHQDLSVPHANVDGVTAVELPYEGGELSLLALLPPAGGLADLEAALDGEYVARVVSALSPGTVALVFPKIRLREALDVVGTLRSLGMTDAFDAARADFSGMTTREPLYIGAAQHEAFLAIDEDGTTAGAATAVEVFSSAIPDVLQFNRPFVLAIRDVPTGALLFVGRVADPSK